MDTDRMVLVIDYLKYQMQAAKRDFDTTGGDMDFFHEEAILLTLLKNAEMLVYGEHKTVI